MKYRFGASLLLILTLAVGQVPVGASPVQLMGWHYNPQIQVLEFALNGPSTPQLSFYDNPPRLVLDLPGVQLARSFRTPVAQGLITQVRAGQPTPDVGRLVVELAQPIDTSQVQLVQSTPTRWRLLLTPQASATLPQVKPEILARPLEPIQTPARTYKPPVVNKPLATPVTARTVSNSLGTPLATVRIEKIVPTLEGYLIRTTGPAEATVRRLDNPTRLVVDLPGTVLPSTFGPRVLPGNRLGVQQLRMGQFQAEPPITRIVLDVQADTWEWEAAYDRRLKGIRLVPAGKLAQLPAPNQGTSITSAALMGDQLLIDADGPMDFKANWNNASREYQVQFSSAALSPAFQGPSLDVTSPLDRLRLFPSEGQTVTAIVQVPTGVYVAGAERRKGNRQFSIRLARIGGPVPTPANAGANPGAEDPVRATKPLIFVDAGHGGSDPGALGAIGIQEKSINLQLSLRLGRRMSDLGYRVAYTRQDDRFITLQGRVDLAEQAGADLFISLHQNASDNPWANGIETYYLRANSVNLASLVHRAMTKGTGRADRGVRQARFHVIRHTTMPAILLEGGYVTNRAEAQQLADPDHQKVMAENIAQALDRFLRGKR